MTLAVARFGSVPRPGPLNAVLLGLLIFAAIGMIMGPSQRMSAQTVARPASPGSPIGAVQALAAITEDSRSIFEAGELALAANAKLPLVAGAVQPARPFELPGWVGLSAADRAQQCLALAMYYEAAYEGEAGRRAVAQVVLNRLRHPAFPHDVCSVVFQRSVSNICQFTFACDGAMQRPRLPGLWRQTMTEAAEALQGKVFAPAGLATHYHADYVFPYWAPRLEKIAVIGRHVFYRWPNGWGLHSAFNAKYAGSEALPASPAVLAVPEPMPLPEGLAPAARGPAPVRSANEGGFVDPSKGWIPRVSLSPSSELVSEKAATEDIAKEF